MNGQPLVIGSMVAAAALAMGLGWLAPGRPAAPVTVTRVQPIRSSEPLQPPSEAEALDVLAGYLVDPPASNSPAGGDPSPHPQRIRAPKPPPPPPPPDVALVFRREVTAIVNQGGQGLAVLVVDASDEGRRSRLLKVGDEFADGWRIATLSSAQAVLAKGDRQKIASFYSGGGPH
jgi:hypothetical protein